MITPKTRRANLPPLQLKKTTSTTPTAANNSSSMTPVLAAVSIVGFNEDAKKRKTSTISASKARPSLQRSYSENVMRSCLRADSKTDLTGDFRRTVALPLLKVNVKHADLNTIDCHTVARLIRGEYRHVVGRFRIIDARYEYEFCGGHVKGAENFGKWDEQVFLDEFLPSTLAPLSPLPPHATTMTDEDEKRPREILIFHCEFSSVRGPAVMRELRKRDRCLNKDSYPALHHPEIYLMHNGYKEFFEHYPELCEPRAYQTMQDPNFAHEERIFRKKSKTWAAGAGGVGGATVARTVSSSSRLLKM